MITIYIYIYIYICLHLYIDSCLVQYNKLVIHKKVRVRWKARDEMHTAFRETCCRIGRGVLTPFEISAGV